MAVLATREVRQELRGVVAPQDILDNSGLGAADTDCRGCNMEERHVGEDGPRVLGDVRVGHQGTHERGVQEDERVGRRLKAGAHRLRNVGVGGVSVGTQWKRAC